MPAHSQQHPRDSHHMQHQQEQEQEQEQEQQQVQGRSLL
jgi:hypothetical protein